MRFNTLSNYHLIDNAMFACSLDELILGFCYSDFDMGNQWIWTCIDYQPCIKSKHQLTKCASHPKLLIAT